MRIKDDDVRLRALMLERREATERKRARFNSNVDVVLVSMKECDFHRLRKTNPQLKTFYHQWDCTFASSQKKKKKKKSKKKLSNSDMLQAILQGTLFGVAVAAIRVPSSWEGTGFYHALSPQEFYEQFPPLFQTTLVEFQDIGSYMQTVIRENQLSHKAAKVVRLHIQRSREKAVSLDYQAIAAAVSKIRFHPPAAQRLLVSVMKSNRLVCSSELLSWYHRHGLQICLEQFLEYKPVACFRSFVTKVTEARQNGSGVEARSMKVLGNAGYGSLLLRKDRFSRVSYVRGEAAMLKATRDPYTKRTTPLKDGVCEVETRPRRVMQDMPTALGVHVLSGAKLVMLRFYYDFLQEFLE